MSDSLTTATPETKNSAPMAHPPVRENQMGAEADRSQIAGQRVMRSMGGGSPSAPPDRFAGALGQMQSISGQAGMLRQLQRSYGNSYVGSVIQAKLTVNQPGDIYEQEADRMAAQVMAMPQSGSIQREMEPKKEKEKIQMMPSLQRASDGNLEAGGNLEGRLNSSKGGGSPLSDDVRSFMEPRFGADFSQVRVHTGSESVQMNQDLNAQAFTHKQDVYFGAGKAPGKDGLTAHELTHVLQQTDNSIQPEFKTTSSSAIQRLQLQEGSPLAHGNYFYGNKIVSLDEKVMRQMLADMIVKQGLKEEKNWQQAFVEDLRNQKANLHSYEDEKSKQTIVVEQVLATRAEQAQTSLEEEISTIEKQFQQELLNSVNTVLDKSEKQIYKEAHRYGLADDESIFQPKPVTAGQAAIQGSLPESNELRQLMQDAKELLDGKRKVEKARKQVAAQGAAADLLIRPAFLEPALLEYHKTRQTLCSRSPILASFERNEEKLAELASGSGKSGVGSLALVNAKEKMRHEIADKLSNIAYVRDQMKEPAKAEKFWLDASLRANTKSNLSIQPLTLANVAVEEKVKQIQEDADFESKLKAAIGIGLLILSFVPGAGLAAGAIGVTMGLADIWGAFQEYCWEEAASGTAFEKAEAISQSDPSLFGLGLSIAFGLLEGVVTAKALEGAIDVFKVLRETYRETRAAAAAAKVSKVSGYAELLNKLKAEADAQRPGLGDKILRDLPADVKAFSENVDQALGKIKDPELKNLVRNGKKPIDGNGSTLMEMAADNPQHLESEFNTWKKSGGKETFEDWLSHQTTKQLHLGILETPAGLVEYGLDAAGARRSYDACIAADPAREVGIWKDPATGERVCVQGKPGAVETAWMTDAENMRDGKMPRWELEMHHHPGRGVMSDNLPSAADFSHIMHWQSVEGVPKRTRSVLSYIDPESKLRFQTEFGFEPGAKRPYWTRYRTSDGTWKIATFEKVPFAEGAAEYEAFVHSFKGDPNAPVPGGNVYPVAETGATVGTLDSASGVPKAPSNTPKIRTEDVTTGPHGPERPLIDVVWRARRENLPQGRWLSRAAGENTVVNLDVSKMQPKQAYSVPIPNGAGELIRNSNAYGQLYTVEPANRAAVILIDGEIHSFPIGLEHPAYNNSAPLIAASTP